MKNNLKRGCNTCALYGVGAHPSRPYSDGLCTHIELAAELTASQNFERRSNVASKYYDMGCDFYSPAEEVLI